MTNNESVKKKNIAERKKKLLELRKKLLELEKIIDTENEGKRRVTQEGCNNNMQPEKKWFPQP